MRSRLPLPVCPSTSHLSPHRAEPSAHLLTRATVVLLALGACTQPANTQRPSASQRQAATASPTLTSITIDGTFADWQQVMLNPLQVSIDGNGINGSGCYPTDTDRDCEGYTPQRDINQFAWTYDDQVISTRLVRPTSSATLTYSFIMDVNADGVAEATDRVLQVEWKNGGRALGVKLLAYVPASPGGDAMACPNTAACPSPTNPHGAVGFVDGYTMPGTTGALLWSPGAPSPSCASSTAGDECGGDGVGTQFEVAVPWAQLGVPSGSPIMWHVTSSTTAEFSQAKDNVGGPDGRIGTFGVFGVDFLPDRWNTTASPGVVDDCHEVVNLGNFPDAYDLFGVSSTGAAVSFYADTGGCTAGRLLGTDANGDGDFSDPGDVVSAGADSTGNGFPDTGPLPKGATFKVLVRLTFPAGKAGVTDQLIATARSVARPTMVSDTVTDFTRLGDVTIIPDLARTGTPGATVDFGPQSVHNNQKTGDTVALSVKSPHGFGVALFFDQNGAPGAFVAQDSNGDGTWDGPAPTVTLASGASESYWLKVFVPPGAAIGTVDGLVFTATSQSAPTKSGSAKDTLTLRTGLSISPSYTAPSNQLLGAAGSAVYLPHVVVNGLSTPATVTLSQTGVLAQGYSLRWWTDPNGDGSIADGAPITGPFTLAAFGGTASIVTEIDIPASGTPASTAAATTVASATDSATANDHVAIGGLQTYADPLLTRPTRAFEACATVYAQGSGLTPLSSTNYQLRYADSSGAVVSSAALPTNNVGQGAGAYTLAAADLLGGWRVSVMSGSTLVSDLSPVAVERSGVVLASAPATLLDGQPVSVSAQLTNTQAQTGTTGSSVTFELVDPSGAVVTSGAVTGLDVANGASTTAYQVFPSLPSGIAGTWQVRATWKTSCGSVIAQGVAASVRLPPAPTLLSPVNGASLATTAPSLTGTALAGASVTITVDGTWTGTGTGPAFSVTPPALAQGAHTWSATQTVSGVQSASSATFTFVVDTQAPAAPVVLAPANGSVTNDSTPTVSGTAEPGATVKVFIGSTLVGTVQASSTGAFSATLGLGQALAEGSYLATATATDPAGNVSPSSAASRFTVDLTAPAAPLIAAPATGSTTADATPTIAGTAEPGSTVTVKVDGVVVGTVTASAGGAFSLTLSAAQALASGSHSATAVATDVAGNVSLPSAPSAFQVDPSAVSVVVVLVPADGASVKTATPTVSGTTAPNTAVAVKVDGVVKGTVTASATGAFSYTLAAAQALPEGVHAASAQGYDLGGNAYPPSNVDTFTVDLTAPLAPVVLVPADGAATQAQPVISGTAEPGTQVTVLVDGVAVGTVATQASGAFSYTLTAAQALATGSHTASARASDAAGNVSPLAAAHAFTVDVTAPATPVLTSPAAGAALATTRPTLTGTAEANSLVTIRIDGAVVGTVTASAAGTFSLTLSAAQALTEGSHAVTLSAADAAGNASPLSAPTAFTVDLTAPAAPVVTSPASGVALGDSTPTITGTAEPGSTVSVLVDGVVVATTTAGSDGTFSVSLPSALGDGTHTVTVTAQDAAGNASSASTPVGFVVDTVAPAAPVVTAPAAGAVLAVSQPTITGTAEPSSAVTVRVDGAVLGVVTADATGAFTLAPGAALPDGTHTVTATAADAAGNTSAPSSPVSFVIDTTPPAAPVLVSPGPGLAVNTGTPLFTGTAEPGTTVSIIVDGAVVGSVVVGADGTFSTTLGTPLGEGSHTVTLVATDAAGNSSTQTAAVDFTVDLTPPATPVVTEPAPGSTLATATPTVAGTAEGGVLVKVFVDGTFVGAVTAGARGQWAYTLTTGQALVDGTHLVVAEAHDAAGNFSPTSAVDVFTVDTTPPGAPTVTSPLSGAAVDPSLTVTGVAEPSSVVTVLVDGAPAGTVSTNSTGGFGLAMGTPLTLGSHVVSAFATDEVGNTGPNAADVPVLVPMPTGTGGGAGGGTGGVHWDGPLGGVTGKDSLAVGNAVTPIPHGNGTPTDGASPDGEAPVVAKAGCGCDAGSADVPALMGLVFMLLSRFRRQPRAR